MATLPEDLPLAEVTMPGTHNTASYSICDGHLSAVVAASRCQSRPLLAQLRLGVRFLDLRVRPDGVLCHGPVSCDSTLRDALDVCTAFLRANPSEVLLVRIKEERGGRAVRGVDDLMREIIEAADHPLYLQGRLPAMWEVRGRMVVLCEWSGSQVGLKWGGEAMRLQDEYQQRSGSKKWQVVQHHLEKAEPSPDLLHVHFTSATFLPLKTPIAIAKSVNAKMARYLPVRPRFLGIIAMDFPSASLCEQLVRLNSTIAPLSLLPGAAAAFPDVVNEADFAPTKPAVPTKVMEGRGADLAPPTPAVPAKVKEGRGDAHSVVAATISDLDKLAVSFETGATVLFDDDQKIGMGGLCSGCSNLLFGALTLGLMPRVKRLST